MMTDFAQDTSQVTTRYFQSYEQREQAFRNNVSSLIARKYSGPRLFWKDFTGVSMEELSDLIRRPLAYITSNPRDGLAFGTPWQVLRAAALCVSKDPKGGLSRLEEVAEEFDLAGLLYQPVRTLSGGETVKLALAKAFIASARASRLIVASPFSWLSRENEVFFKKLFDHCNRQGTVVELLALEGEDSDKPVSAEEFAGQSIRDPIDFTICFKDLRIPLGSSINPIYSRQIYAGVNDFEAHLRSPCLIVGENGQGKSLVAKLLAGAIAIEGQAGLTCADKSGPPRLLFQDVITQTLLRSYDAIADATIHVDGWQPVELCEKLLQEYNTRYRAFKPGGVRENMIGGGFRSLLEIKFMLMAVRLCGRPAALILDEPDWGLTRASAVALVAAVVKVAHDLGIPVVLISHKPWWQPMANSILAVQRTPTAEKSKGSAAFDIRVSTAGK